ncbi:MAG TPA: NAD(P)H-hydrate dehydratase [Clostridiaceae bacterium]|nr:NAD(P)H-hydrate dehydratase [Clostridiaceae bacterium]
MTRLLTREQQKTLDVRFSEVTGLPSVSLMEQAASCMSEFIEWLTISHDIGEEYHVIYFTGAGNNGGDGWASARQLMASRRRVAVFDVYPDRELSPDAEINRSAYKKLGGEVITKKEDLANKKAEFVVDAIYGTGFDVSRSLSCRVKEALSLLALMKESGSNVIACDIPSGVDANTGFAAPEAVSADVTFTFGRRKIGNVTHPGCMMAGEVILSRISMTDEFVDETLGDDRRVLVLESETEILPDRARDGHKGQFGRLLLIGGAEGMAGAMILAARAGEKAGVGYTMIRTVEASMPLIASAIPSALLSVVPEEGETTKKDLPEPSAIAIGVGAGKAPWVEKALRYILPLNVPVVVDADGLNVLANMAEAFEILRSRTENGFPPAVLTPHPGEFLRLVPEASELLRKDRLEAARFLADKAQSIIVLKGMATVIAMPNGDAYINTSGNVGLAKGGSGDVLTGLIAGLAAQTDSIESAVTRAVYLHGLAADIAADNLMSETVVTPEDVIDALGEALFRP